GGSQPVQQVLLYDRHPGAEHRHGLRPDRRAALHRGRNQLDARRRLRSMSAGIPAPAARLKPLNVETLLERARARAMLQDFGDPAFRVALDRFVEAINTESLLNA